MKAEPFLLRDLPRFECLQKRALRYPDLDAEAVDATLSLLRVASDVLEGMTAHLERNGITQSRFLVLMLLDRHANDDDGAQSPHLPSHLAEQLNVSRATVTGLLDGLERDALLERRPHGNDRRALTLHLTPQGRAYLEAMLPDHYRRVAGLMAHLSPRERKQLTALLAKVARGADALHAADWQPADPQPIPLETAS